MIMKVETKIFDLLWIYLNSELPGWGDYHTFRLKATFPRPGGKNMKSESGSNFHLKRSENCISERPPIHIVCEQGVEDGEEKSCSFAGA